MRSTQLNAINLNINFNLNWIHIIRIINVVRYEMNKYTHFNNYFRIDALFSVREKTLTQIWSDCFFFAFLLLLYRFVFWFLATEKWSTIPVSRMCMYNCTHTHRRRQFSECHRLQWQTNSNCWLCCLTAQIYMRCNALVLISTMCFTKLIKIQTIKHFDHHIRQPT